jgi:serine/threonine protein kinase
MPDAVVMELFEELTNRLQAGQPLDLEEYVARYPEHADQLRQFWPSIEVLVSLGRAASGPPGHSPAAGTAAPEALGELGDFRLLREVGRGGMGVVYAAEQISLGRRVALKVLPFASTLDARQLQRFKNEAQAAACLHHTNIVPVYATGCERGVHYYAMQFIDGETLAAVIAELRRLGKTEPAPRAGFNDPDSTGSYAPAPRDDESAAASQAAGLSTPAGAVLVTEGSARSPAFFRAVALLAVQAAHALEYAHQEGVVHRDIKPANLLVATASPLSTGGEGVRLWVTDFGLAHCQSQAGLTMTGDLVGTLRYMSPEQALAKRAVVDHRTDVYSLGVTLYELLTLEPAFGGRDREELLRQIAVEEPRPPRRLNPAVPAELETIVLKAMEKNPAERYATAQELADDLERFLKDEPIRARRPTAFQRVRKWSRRHRSVVAAAAAVLAVLLLASWVSTALIARAWRDERDQRTRAEQNEGRAQANEQLAEQRFHEAEAAHQSSRQMLNGITDAALEQLLGRQVQLGAQEKAFLRQVERSYEELARRQGETRQARWDRADGLARVGAVRHRLGELKGAESAYRRARVRFQELSDEFPGTSLYRLGVIKCLNQLGMLRMDTGRPVEAEADYRAALALLKPLASGAADAPDRRLYRQALAMISGNLGILLARAHRAREAEAAYGDAIALYKKLVADFPALPEYGLGLASGHLNLGFLLLDTGRPAKAETSFRAAVALLKKLAADPSAVPHYRHSLAKAYLNLGVLLNDPRRARDAEQSDRDALAILKKLAADFPTVPFYRHDLAQASYNYGRLLDRTGRPDEAESAYQDALVLWRKLAADFPTVPDHRKGLAETHVVLGVLFRQTRRVEEAAGEMLAAATLLKKLLDDSPTTLEYRTDLAKTYNDLCALLPNIGRLDEAEAAGRAALALRQKLTAQFPDFPDYANELAGTLVNLAVVKHAAGNDAEARKLLEQARPHHERALQANPGHPAYRLFFRNNRGLLCLALVGLGDHAAVAATAGELANFRYQPSSDCYDAACYVSRCIALAERDAKLPAAERRALADRYAAQAVTLLGQAVRAGCRNAARMRQEKALAPLGGRADFQKLLAELESKARAGPRLPQGQGPAR